MDAQPVSQPPGPSHGLSYWAWRLDRWMQRQFGTPYRIVLSAGLVASIGASWNALVTTIHSSTNVAIIIATVLFQTLLLINQLAQMHQRRRARVRRKALRAPS
jgi:hypothetical protein